MRGCGCLTLMLALGLIFGGGQGIYEGITNRTPKVMTFQQFEKAPPSSGWLQLTGCQLDVTGAMYIEKLGTIEKVFIPVQAAGEDDEKKPIALLLQVKDPKILKTVEELKVLDNNGKGDESKMLKYQLEHLNDLVIERNVDGMMAFGVNDLQSRERDQIASLSNNLTSNFALLKEGEKPNLLVSFAQLLGGLVVLAFTFIGFGGKKKNESTPGAGAPGAGGTGGDAAPPSAWGTTSS